MKIFFLLGIFACDAGKFTGVKTKGHLREHHFDYRNSAFKYGQVQPYNLSHTGHDFYPVSPLVFVVSRRHTTYKS